MRIVVEMTEIASLILLSFLLLLLSPISLSFLIQKRGTLPLYSPVKSSASLLSYEAELMQLFNKTRPSVVFVSTLSTVFNPFMMNVLEIPSQSGSGFVWDRSGHIVTNYHVLGATQSSTNPPILPNEFMVSFVNEDGSREGIKASVKGVDADKDVAVLLLSSLPKTQRLTCVKLGDSESLRVGQLTLAIGNPFGLDQTLTTGVVSGLGRQVATSSKKVIYNMIQTDAAINPGTFTLIYCIEARLEMD